MSEQVCLTDQDISRAQSSVYSRLDTPEKGHAAHKLIGLGMMPDLVSPLILNKDLSTECYGQLSRVFGEMPLPALYDQSRAYFAEYQRLSPTPSLVQPVDALPSDSKGLKVAIVGNGPAAVITGRMLYCVGLRNITYIAEHAEPGGIWASTGPWGADRTNGYNNPKPLSFGGQIHLPIEPSRPTRLMQDFLSRMVEPGYQKNFINGRVLGVDTSTYPHKVNYSSPDTGNNQLSADFVVVATGNQPLPLNGPEGYIKFNQTETVDINRWPTTLTTEQAIQIYRNGQRIVCIGWGNSTLSKLREIERLNDQLGINLDVVVLSHLSSDSLTNPYKKVLQLDGTMQSVARVPSQGELTRLELDVEGAMELYAKYQRISQDSPDTCYFGTISDVKECDFGRSIGTNQPFAVVRFTNSQNQVQAVKISNIGQINALLGYGNNPERMRSCGFEVTDEYRGTIDVRPFDGKAVNQPRNEVYAIGAAAAGRKNPNQRVIPAIMSWAAEIAFSAAITSMTKRYSA